MADDGPATVEVLYALPQRQWIVRVPLSPDMTALDAVKASGLLEAHPAIAAGPLILGLFGVEIGSAHRLEPGDRVEICRPLSEDPRAMRRHFVETGRVMGQGEDEA